MASTLTPDGRLHLERLCSIAPSQQLLPKLVREAAAFVRSLEGSPLALELERRTERYQELVGPETPFSAARTAALGQLDNVIGLLYLLTEERFRLWWASGRRVVKRVPKLTATLDSLRDCVSRLEDPMWAALHLADAAQDVKDWMDIPSLEPTAAEALQAWHQELWRVLAQVEDADLLGCFLLSASDEAVADGMGGRPCQALLARLTEDVALFTKAIQDAAKTLAGLPPPSKQGKAEAAKKVWWHEPTEQIPEQYKKNGPVVTNQKNLAAKLRKAQVGKSKDYRSLRAAAAGIIWVVRSGRAKTIAVYCMSADLHEKIKGQ
jgi:hypothetical protein